MIFIAILAGILVAPVALIMALPVFLPAIIWLLIWVAKLAGIIFAIWLVIWIVRTAKESDNKLPDEKNDNLYKTPDKSLNKSLDKTPKFLSILFYGFIPITFVCVLCAMIYFSIGPDSSVTFYNISSIENVDEIYVKQSGQDEWQKVFPKLVLKTQLKQNNKVGLRLDSGIYEFKIISHKTDESGNIQKYEVLLAGNSARCEKEKELLLCYGGKNFYEFSENDKVYKDGKLVDINKPVSSPVSVKRILDEAE